MKKFQKDEKVLIKSTEELPTIYDGQFGWVEKPKFMKDGFLTITTKDGMNNVYHESQIHPTKQK